MTVLGMGDSAPPRYRLYGLTVRSAIALPLPAASGETDVAVELGAVNLIGEPIVRARGAVRFTCLRDGDDVIVAWPGTSFRVGADRVVVDARDEALASHLLLNVVWPVVMSARGSEVLHGSVVEREERAIAFLGASGMGKSTACRMLVDQGCRMVTDDLVLLDGAGAVVPGPPFLRLPGDPGSASSQSADAGGKIRVTQPVGSDPVTLTAIVVLAPEHRSDRVLRGLAAVNAIMTHVSNPAPTHPGQGRRRLDQALALVARVPIRGVPPRSITNDQARRLMSEGW